MQNHPDEPAKTVSNGPDSLFVFEARSQTAIEQFEDAALALHRSIGSLIQKSAHLAIAFGRTVAFILASALFLSRAYSYPGRQMLICRKGCGCGSHFCNNL